MLTELSLANYKCFKEKKAFPLSNINLFTGFNGRGKSSVLQAILLMSQTAISSGTLRELLISSSWLRLGDFNDIKSAISPQKDDLSFGFKTNLETLKSFEFQYTSKKSFPDRALLKDYIVNGERSTTDSLSGALSESSESSNNKMVIYQDDPRILKIFKNVHYVSADRIGPVLYVDKYGMPDIIKTGLHGEHTVKILSNYTNELNPLLFLNKKAKDIKELCEEWMNYIFDGASIRVKANEDDSVLSLSLNPKSDEHYYKSVNVGFGYSYVLALIVSALIAKEGDIVIFENPEAHLHPRAQSRLMELFTKVALLGVQIFIESHSEHILNGIRLAIANKNNALSNENVEAYYFDEEFKVNHLEIASNGFIQDWPIGFFDQNELDMIMLFRYSQEHK